MPDHAAASQAPQAVVFRARNLSKVYMMGEVAVHALRDIDLDIYEREFEQFSAGEPGDPKQPALTIEDLSAQLAELLTRHKIARACRRNFAWRPYRTAFRGHHAGHGRPSHPHRHHTALYR